MSTAAQTILEEFKNLPAPEQREVSWQIQRWLATAASASVDADPIRSARGMLAGSGASKALPESHADALAALARLRGSSKGKGLLAALLADRAEERARG